MDQTRFFFTIHERRKETSMHEKTNLFMRLHIELYDALMEVSCVCVCVCGHISVSLTESRHKHKRVRIGPVTEATTTSS